MYSDLSSNVKASKYFKQKGKIDKLGDLGGQCEFFFKQTTNDADKI